MNALIVYAHPEPKSFNGALKDLAVRFLTEQGHQVQVSDLYAMNFKAVADREDFVELSNPEFFKYQLEQIHASQNGLFSPDIAAEMEKLRWADFVLFQFPLWWFSVPAILKGWIDRVFAMGFVYGGGMWYDKGGLKGKKAMLSLTTGGPAHIYSKDGINGDIDQILFPIHHGMLFFSGMEVLPPFIAWSVASASDEQRERYLEEFKQRLLTIESTEPIPFHPLSHYGENLQLKDEYKD
ncbi:NAD(P)H dehydrogenase [Collibacillus ludicampi]|jgi:NAD(P)H dehydrogenase (quinone)|uniref:NAD(P)H dehydrogenase n=1 Tax=Collibacillus ludicampi TaxID=2771369 RepID=A0AAV4LC91_9BACL|nr:NAD(P)H-dependent oxidoreductase [Collibacillus ludicampi]GIM45425.1 NAD(P)H dehydrogenase [Collibacillus ludicampi]